MDRPPSQPRLVLASASPRRRELLSGLGLEFEVLAPEVDETSPVGCCDLGAVREWVIALAERKAAAVADELSADTWVLAADTTVTLAGRIFNKPADEGEARAMLAQLEGRTHTVLTGVALRRGGRDAEAPWAAAAATQVTFYPCSDEQIAAYVATGESLDKAGGYAAQGRGALIIERIEGCYFNVVGLPLALVGRLLTTAGFDLWAAGSAA